MDRKQEFCYIIKFVEEHKIKPIVKLFTEEDTDFPKENWNFNVLYQLKSLWTTYCLHHDLACDTSDYDEDVLHVFDVLVEQNPLWDNVEFEKFDLWLGSYIS